MKKTLLSILMIASCFSIANAQLIDAVKGGGDLIMRASPMRGATTDVTNLDAVVTTLYQNEPNPFTERTVIRVDVWQRMCLMPISTYII